VAADAPLVFLGRIEHIKGVHVAIDVARRAGRRLVIAGTVADEHREYFERHVVPAIRGGDVSYVGPVDDNAKSDLLGRALALLMPVLWDEPFGIVMAEALACGTPVIGFDRGAVSEVVDHGHTGIVCGDEAGMVEGVAQVARIDRAACRLTAERRFSAGVLVDAYESLYAELAGVPSARVAEHSTVVSDTGSPAN
jgi:glycosyltransferase involved in cell wall biosynthesis